MLSLSLLKQNRVQFVSANHSWAWGLPWTVVNISSVTSLQKTDFSSPGDYQLMIVFWLGGGNSVLSLLGAWILPCICSVLPAMISVSSHIPCCIWKTLLPSRYAPPLPPLDLAVFSPSVPCRSTSFEGKGIIIKTSYLKLRIAKSFILCISTCWGFLCQLLSSETRSFCD